MSELKYYKLRHIVSALASPDFIIGVVFGDHDEVYNRPDVDKVIAELKNEIEEQKRLRNMALASVPNVLKVMKIIQHNKYKRCLAMAELCCERKENCYNIALRKYTKSEADSLVKKSEFWEEWEDTWTQLAYRFNGAK